MNRDIIREIARKNNTTVKEVRAAMQEALDYAERSAQQDELVRKRLENIYGGKPRTPENFIAGAADEVKRRMQKQDT